jgi:hypothetical protein
MKAQYDNATEDQLENAANGLCNATLNKLYPSNEYIVTPQYYFGLRNGQKFYADFVVERIWPTGQRAIVLVVEVKPAQQSEAQDAESDDQAEDYGVTVLNMRPTQWIVYAAKFIGGQCMFYWLTRAQPTLNPLATDFMDIEDDYVAIRGHAQTMKSRNLFG